MTTESLNPDTLGRRLFSFGVITDTHVNQGEDDCNSPFDVNRLANRRMRHVIRDLNARDLAFVVNVGDLVHPVPPSRISTPQRRHDSMSRSKN
jgi:metallophosphoesterase superfamily enzyme